MVSRSHYYMARGTPTDSDVAGPRAYVLCLAFIREIPFGVDQIVILPKTKNESLNHSSFVYNPAFIRQKNTSNIRNNQCSKRVLEEKAGVLFNIHMCY